MTMPKRSACGWTSCDSNGRQWGSSWLSCILWRQLDLNAFWATPLPPSREGTPWRQVLQTLVTYRLTNPGSESRLYRHWFDASAMGDLLNVDFAVAEKNTLYKHSDCRQVVVGLIVTPEEFPLSYEVLAGNTADSTTQSDFLKRIALTRDQLLKNWAPPNTRLGARPI